MEDHRLTKLKRALSQRGWQWRPGKPIAYGEQLLVGDGQHEARLDFYPKRGRTVIGGSPSPLREALSKLALDLEGQPAPSSPPAPTAGRAPNAAVGHAVAPNAVPAEIGMDESGKGDWFGPLVVAAVLVEPAQIEPLRQAGVRDSKQIESAALPKVAAAITALLPATSYAVLVLDPVDYNRRYAEQANINLLLAALYAELAAPLAAQTGISRIVCDQFAQSPDRLNRSFARMGLPRPEQRHHAEATSLAVAAASVLATTRFRAELVRLGQQAGLAGPLPKGASAIGPLTRTVRHIIAREGPDALAHYAKLNFRPVRELLEQP